MEIKCSVIKDLLPSYADALCGADTAALVEEHIAACPDCAKILAKMKSDKLQRAVGSEIAAAQAKAPFKKLAKKNKIHVLLTAVLTAALCAAGILVYSYYTPRIEYVLGRPVDLNTGFYTENITFGYSEKFGLPLPGKIKEHFSEFSDKNTEVIKSFTDFKAPTEIHIRIELKNGQTVVTYSGTATAKDGKTVEYNKQLIFDFVLTTDIPSELQD